MDKETYRNILIDQIQRKKVTHNYILVQNNPQSVWSFFSFMTCFILVIRIQIIIIFCSDENVHIPSSTFDQLDILLCSIANIRSIHALSSNWVHLNSVNEKTTRLLIEKVCELKSTGLHSIQNEMLKMFTIH